MDWIDKKWHPLTLEIIFNHFKKSDINLPNESLIKVFDYVDMVIKSRI
jgi:hypothetical protein